MITKKAPPAKMAQTTTKNNDMFYLAGPRKKTPKIEGTETEPQKQMFFANFSENQLTIKFDRSYFGIKRDNTLEKFIRNCEAKDTEQITKILTLIRLLMNNHVSTKDIAEKFNLTQTPNNYSQSIRQYANILSKPLTNTKVSISTKDKHPVTLELLDTE